jgi:hypothetical protein
MQKGEVIPFLGVDAVFPRLRKVLSERLARFTGVDATKSSSLTLLSQYCEMKVSRRKLYDKVAEILAEELDHTSTTVHELLVTLEKPLIVMTTMCDLLLENLFRDKNKKYILLTHLLNPRNPEYKGKVVVKYFHGADAEETKDKILAPQHLVIQDKELEEYSIIYKLQGCLDLPNLDIDGEKGDSLVISEKDYLSLLKWFSIPNVLARPLQENMLLFLGCSMQDWSFRVLIHTLLRDIKYLDCRPHAVRKTDDDIEKAFWRGIGQGEKTLELIEQELSSFLSELAEEMEVSLNV